MNKADAEKILGLTGPQVSQYTQADLKKRYFALAKKLHPDAQMGAPTAHSTARMAQVNEAFAYLDSVFTQTKSRVLTPTPQAQQSQGARRQTASSGHTASRRHTQTQRTHPHAQQQSQQYGADWVKDSRGWAHSTTDNSADSWTHGSASSASSDFGRSTKSASGKAEYKTTNTHQYWQNWYSATQGSSGNANGSNAAQSKTSAYHEASRHGYTAHSDQHADPFRAAYTSQERWEKASKTAKQAADFLDGEPLFRDGKIDPHAVAKRVWGFAPGRFKAYLYTILGCLIILLFTLFYSIIKAIGGVYLSPLWSLAALLLFLYSFLPFLSKHVYRIYCAVQQRLTRHKHRKQ